MDLDGCWKLIQTSHGFTVSLWNCFDSVYTVQGKNTDCSLAIVHTIDSIGSRSWSVGSASSCTIAQDWLNMVFMRKIIWGRLDQMQRMGRFLASAQNLVNETSRLSLWPMSWDADRPGAWDNARACRYKHGKAVPRAACQLANLHVHISSVYILNSIVISLYDYSIWDCATSP